jgi:hypothetical protein
VLLHVLVCTLVNIIVLARMLSYCHIWLVIAGIAIIHIALDRTKIFLAVFRAKDGLGYFFIDQSLHALSLMLAAWYLQQVIPANEIILWIPLQWTVSITALAIAAFATPPIIHYVQRSISSRRDHMRDVLFPSWRHRLPGTLFRLVSTLGLVLGNWYAMLFLTNLLTLVFPTPIPCKHKKYRYIELFINVCISLFCGLFVWYFKQ